jgi:hypothetical protein
VIIVWECQLKKTSLATTIDRVEAVIKESEKRWLRLQEDRKAERERMRIERERKIVLRNYEVVTRSNPL